MGGTLREARAGVDAGERARARRGAGQMRTLAEGAPVCEAARSVRALLRLSDLLRVLLLCGTLAAIAASDARAAGILAVGAAVAVLVRFAMLPAPYDLAFVAALGVQCGGEALGLYDSLSWFDTLMHVTIPALTAPVAYLALARLEVVRDLRDPAGDLVGRGDVGIFVVTVALGLAVGAVWELCEGLFDTALGSSLQESTADTNRDLLADGIGAVVGAIGLVMWNRRGRGTVKRGPGGSSGERDA